MPPKYLSRVLAFMAMRHLAGVEALSCGSSGRAIKLRQPTCRKRDQGRDSQRYKVTVVTPPPRSLGTHRFAPNTQCGETVTVRGDSYIVSGVVYRYQLRHGKYEPGTRRLEVQPTGRYFLNMYLDGLLTSGH